MYKNNNGNYSRRVVPIHRLQPKPHAASDYCYSGRLHSRSYDLYLQPWAFRFCFLQQILPAVLFSRLATGLPGRSVLQAPVRISRRIRHQFQVTRGRSSLFSWGPVTQSLKERFHFSGDLLNIRDRSGTGFPLSMLRLSWYADPEVWPNRIVFHLSNLFRFHIVRAAFYRSPDRSNLY